MPTESPITSSSEPLAAWEFRPKCSPHDLPRRPTPYRRCGGAQRGGRALGQAANPSRQVPRTLRPPWVGCGRMAGAGGVDGRGIKQRGAQPGTPNPNAPRAACHRSGRGFICGPVATPAHGITASYCPTRSRENPEHGSCQATTGNNIKGRFCFQRRRSHTFIQQAGGWGKGLGRSVVSQFESRRARFTQRCHRLCSRSRARRIALSGLTHRCASASVQALPNGKPS